MQGYKVHVSFGAGPVLIIAPLTLCVVTFLSTMSKAVRALVGMSTLALIVSLESGAEVCLDLGQVLLSSHRSLRLSMQQNSVYLAF